MDSNGWNAECYANGGLPALNIAMYSLVEDLLGPGLRLCLWVQGCKRACPGCMAPEWRAPLPRELTTPEALAREVILPAEAPGVTLSGGEPMLQAAGLAEALSITRSERATHVICYTGYRLEELRSDPPAPGVEALLGLVDVLIDGAYVDHLNDDKGLRGSANQRIHALTQHPSLDRQVLESCRRRIQISLTAETLAVVGIPTISMLSGIQSIGTDDPDDRQGADSDEWP